MIFLDMEGHAAGVQECYVSGANSKICIDNSTPEHLRPHNHPIKFQIAQKNMGKTSI